MANARKKRELPPHVEAAIAALPESGTITVACKLPNGIILQLFDMVEQEEVTLAGSRTIEKAMPKDMAPVTIKGCSAPHGSAIMTVGGYALTHGVDAQFFAEWLRQHADSDIVKARLLFAHEDRVYVSDKAEESAKVLSGLQPMVPSEDGGDIRDPNRRKLKTFSEGDNAAQAA